MKRLAVEQPVDVVRLRAVAAQQAVASQDPQIAKTCDRLVRGLRNLVRIGQAVSQVLTEQLQQLKNAPQQDALFGVVLRGAHLWRGPSRPAGIVCISACQRSRV